MAIHIILLALLSFFMYIEKDTNSKRMMWFVFFYMFILFGLRAYDVGVDTIRYYEEYQSGYSTLRGEDVGYSHYVDFLIGLHIPARLFLIISSFIILFPHFLFLNKDTYNHRAFPLLLYITIGTYAVHLSGLRQAMAMGLSLFGVVLFMSGKKILLKYIILAVFAYLASLFHYSAIACYLYLPLLFFAEKELKQNSFFINVLLLLLPIVAIVFSNLFAPVVDYFMIARYEDYELGTEGKNVIAYFVIPYVMFAYTLWLRRKVGTENLIDRFGYLCAIVYIICTAASSYMPMLARIGYFFSFPMLVTISDLTYKLSKDTRNVFLVIISIICIAFFLIANSGGNLQIDHYHFGWN